MHQLYDTAVGYYVVVVDVVILDYFDFLLEGLNP